MASGHRWWCRETRQTLSHVDLRNGNVQFATLDILDGWARQREETGRIGFTFIFTCCEQVASKPKPGNSELVYRATHILSIGFSWWDRLFAMFCLACCLAYNANSFHIWILICHIVVYYTIVYVKMRNIFEIIHLGLSCWDLCLTLWILLVDWSETWIYHLLDQSQTVVG